MQQTHYIHIGNTKKVHGKEGELKADIFDEYLEDALSAEFIFLEIDGGKVPFFVENIRMTGTPLVLFEDLFDNEDALPYTAKKMFLPEASIIPEEERRIEVVSETLKYRPYIAYQIEDSATGLVGTIEDIVEFPQQEMALVIKDGREIFIPMSEGLIQKINKEKRLIIMNLPEGLLDL